MAIKLMSLKRRLGRLLKFLRMPVVRHAITKELIWNIDTCLYSDKEISGYVRSSEVLQLLRRPINLDERLKSEFRKEIVNILTSNSTNRLFIKHSRQGGRNPY